MSWATYFSRQTKKSWFIYFSYKSFGVFVSLEIESISNSSFSVVLKKLVILNLYNNISGLQFAELIKYIVYL